MCSVMEKYEKLAAKIAAEEAMNKANIEAIINMITIFHATKEQITAAYTEEEYTEAIEQLEKKEKEMSIV